MKNKLILFGGTFDPIHLGHTAVALAASKKIGAAKTVFIPARRSPHKKIFPIADAQSRLEMISLAISDTPNFSVSDYELKKTEPSYTLNTVLNFLAGPGKDTKIYWLIGADTVKDLPKWYKIHDLNEICNLSVMFRAGFDKPDFTGLEAVLGENGVKKLRSNVIETPLIDLSSTQIRQKIAHQEPISAIVNPDVAAYIQKNKLYS